jgi:poly-gamma-glutamate capsule biosynthesis protein CapA/YwtB (metallophosphatase superfamily)
VVVASIHWGSNWGYEVPSAHVRFAHALIDDGAVDIVHGHSSHHPRPVEVYRGKLVLYGCGDLLDDYEGIPGYEAFRDDLVLLYFASIDSRTGELADLGVTPMRISKMQLTRVVPADAVWLRDTLDEVSRRFGSGVELTAEGRLELHWPRGAAEPPPARFVS